MPFRTLTPAMVEEFTAAGHWGDRTFCDLFLERVAAHSEREALVDATRCITYGELDDKVRRTAAFLRERRPHCGRRGGHDEAAMARVRREQPVKSDEVASRARHECRQAAQRPVHRRRRHAVRV